MPPVDESRHSGEHVLSEANGSRSRENGVLASGQSLDAGAVLGLVTASGEYAAYDPDASNGTENPAGVLYAATDASAAAAGCVVHARDCEVSIETLSWGSGVDSAEQAAALIAMKAIGIIGR
ncbi:MAG: head decoration protein [Pseudomonadota bacterium]